MEEETGALCDICVNHDECNGHYMMCPFFEPKKENREDNPQSEPPAADNR
ncbi:MAG: hypothetical protein J6U98_08255 [Abditibacteriota bacterium]|nr:hypothetical protein [Abditibacteriota bacterium]